MKSTDDMAVDYAARKVAPQRKTGDGAQGADMAPPNWLDHIIGLRVHGDLNLRTGLQPGTGAVAAPAGDAGEVSHLVPSEPEPLRPPQAASCASSDARQARVCHPRDDSRSPAFCQQRGRRDGIPLVNGQCAKLATPPVPWHPGAGVAGWVRVGAAQPRADQQPPRLLVSGDQPGRVTCGGADRWTWPRACSAASPGAGCSRWACSNGSCAGVVTPASLYTSLYTLLAKPSYMYTAS